MRAFFLQWPKFFARAAGMLAMVFGVVCSIAWFWGMPYRGSIFDHVFYWPKMEPITAFAFFLVGISLSCVASVLCRGKKLVDWLHVWSAILVIGIGAFKLSEHVFGWTLDLIGLSGLPNPYLPLFMRPLNALSFILLGSALLLAKGSRFILVFQFLTLLVILIGWIGLSNYLFGGGPMMSLLSYEAMGPYTSCLFILLGFGVLCSRTDSELMSLLMSNSKGGLMARYFLLPIILAPFVFQALELWTSNSGWLGQQEAGAWLFMILNMLMLGAFFWFHIALLHRIDIRRGHAEAKNMRLVNIVNSSGDSIIGEDMNGIITSWNRGSEKIFGYTTEEMIGNSILRLIPLDRQAEALRVMDRFRRGENIEHFETQRQAKDGRMIMISITVSPILDASGNVCGVSNVSRDITERVQAQQALHDSEERLRIVTENARVGLLVINRDRIYTFANAAIGEFVGQSPLGLVGKHVANFMEATYDDKIRPCLDRAFRGERVNFEVQKQEAPSDETRFFSIKYEPIRVGGLISFVVAVITDITDQKRIEAELHSQSEELKMLHVVMIKREERVYDLKQEINKLLARQKAPPRYLLNI